MDLAARTILSHGTPNFHIANAYNIIVVHINDWPSKDTFRQHKLLVLLKPGTLCSADWKVVFSGSIWRAMAILNNTVCNESFHIADLF